MRIQITLKEFTIAVTVILLLYTFFGLYHPEVPEPEFCPAPERTRIRPQFTPPTEDAMKYKNWWAPGEKR